MKQLLYHDFPDESYKEIIQSETNELLSELARLKQDLRNKKDELNNKLVELQKSREKVSVQKNDLDKKKDELSIKVLAYEAEINKLILESGDVQGGIALLEEAKGKKEAEAEKIRQEIFNNFSPIQGGSYVVTGTMVGRQGCTGLCTGAHLHFMVTYNGQYQDPCGWLKPGGPVSGCGWGSSLEWPIRGQVYYTSAFGNRCFQWGGAPYCDFHNAADFAGVPWNTPIYAAHNGYLYKGVDPYGANYVVICENASCGSGLKTGYWHLSSF